MPKHPATMPTMPRAADGSPGPALAHPLESIALAAFRGREVLESRTLAPSLGGTSAAHRKIAAELLDSMERRGLAWRNDAGEYRLFDDPQPQPDPFARLTKVARCGDRRPTYPPGFEEFVDEPAVSFDELLGRFARWARAAVKDGAATILVKSVALGPDGKVMRNP